MKSIIYLILAVTFWGLNFHFAKQMLSEASFLEAGFWRYAFGVLALFALSIKSLPKLTEFLKAPKGLLLIGVIGLFGFNLLFFFGLLYTSPVNASLIVSLNPAMTLVFSYVILRTKITKFEIIGMLISLVGVIILLTKFDMQRLLELEFSKGDILIFIANLVFALQNIWVKQYAPSFTNIHFTIFTNAICLICFILVLPLAVPIVSVQHSTHFWWSAFGIGCLGTGVAYLFWNNGVSAIGPSKAGIFMNFVPLSTALSAIFLHQQLYQYHLISGVIILAGIIITQSNNFTKKNKIYVQ